MSRENVEVVRRAWEGFSDGIDLANLAAAVDQLGVAPDATLSAPEVPGSKATYIGREGFLEFISLWTEDFLNWRIWAEEIIDAGNDRVVAVVRQVATGKASGAPVELRFGVVYTFRGGVIVHQRYYLDSEAALADAGLRPS